jgi:hypothetical protein
METTPPQRSTATPTAIRKSNMKANIKHRLNQVTAAAKIIPGCGHASVWPSHGNHPVR